MQKAGLEFFFTDGHARSETSRKFTSLDYLDELDWDAIYATDWRNTEADLRRKDKKQSEFLVKSLYPSSVLSILECTINQQRIVCLLSCRRIP